MRLKPLYSSREVTALTGLSAHQLQWWDAKRLLRPSVPAHKTAAGGFTARRYSPVDLFELAAPAAAGHRGGGDAADAESAAPRPPEGRQDRDEQIPRPALADRKHPLE